MRLITFKKSNGQESIGAWFDEDRKILDLLKADKCLGGSEESSKIFCSMLDLINSGNAGLERARRVFDKKPDESIIETNEVKILSPVPKPVQMRDFVAFELHMKQARRSAAKMRLRGHPEADKEFEKLSISGALDIPPVWYERPIYYKANRLAVIGSEEDILWPDYATVLDYELEFGIFIGKKGKNIKKEDAKSYIFGFTVFNDVSARDVQAKESPGMMGPAKGKDFDSGNVLGPCIVTSDEIEDPYNLKMQAFVDGELWSEGSTSTMYHRFEEIISYVSQSETIYPGEFFGSGTVGNGCGYELGKFPKPGNTIELKIEKIGAIKNKLVKN